MTNFQFCFFFWMSVLISTCESHTQETNAPPNFVYARTKRGITTRNDANQQIFYPAIPLQYLPQDRISNQIHAELSTIENMLQTLLSKFSSLQQTLASNTNLPKEYGPPALKDSSSQFTEKYINDNLNDTKLAVQNLKSVADNLQRDINTPEVRKRPLNRKEQTIIAPNQHYHISAAGEFPEFLTLDPFVAYGPAPLINFAPPAPGGTSGLTTTDEDIYSPPDGALLAPPAPGELPIRIKY